MRTQVSQAWKYLAAFAGLFLLLFLASDRRINLYDEGILLTNAMRAMSGQVVHRDFYYNYGPAKIYLLAGLFKVFGPSVFVERLLKTFSDSLLVLSVYAMTRRLSRPSVAVGALLLSMLWLLSAESLPITVMLWATWLLASVFQQDLPPGRALAAGLLAGLATLFRYDVGIGLIGCHLLTIGIALGLRRQFRAIARNLWAYIVGVAIVVAPAWLAYLHLAPMHDLLFDIVIYTAKYYRLGRGLPFPGRYSLPADLVAYVLIVIMAMGFYVAVRYVVAFRRGVPIPQWIGVLIAFLLVSAMTYVKGAVRTDAVHLEPCVMPCIVLAAVLYEHRASMGPGRTLLVATIVVFFVLGASATNVLISMERKNHSSMLVWMKERKGDSWCKDNNPVTRGICYTMDSDHIQTVEFLEAHTMPRDMLYVGLPQHDRIYINDNLTYFAAERLPATKWSHFDPFLQNSVETQQEMIADLELNKPPYVVLDSEFDKAREPNGSSVHTGVHLLDNYIEQHYHHVKTFGEMTILERSINTNSSADN